MYLTLQAMKRLVFACLLILFLPLGVRAQSWCPPGAEWHWTIFSLGVDGYVHRWYDGDTVVDGRNAQKIRETGVVINYFSSDTSFIDATRFTSVDAQDVLLWTEDNGAWQWDTLFRFGAGPGTIWRPANGFYGQGDCLVLITDTATTSDFGQPLKRVTLSYLEPDSTPTSFGTVITERIGSEHGSWLLAYQCVLDAEVEMLRCYSDLGLNYVDPNWNYGCASFLGQNDSMADRAPPIFPNPGADHFTLDLPPGTHLVEVFDVTGRKLLTQRAGPGRVTIGTQALPSGTYLVRVDGAQPMRWLKAGSK